MKLLPRSLRLRLLLITLVSLVGVSLLVLVNASNVLQSTARESIELSVAQASETLNIAIAPNTTSEGLEILGEYFEEMVSEDGKSLVYLTIVDDRGTPLLATRTTPDPLPPPTGDLALGLEQDLVHIRQRILLYGNKVGNLQYGLTTRLLRNAVTELHTRNTLLIASGVLLFGGFVSFFLWRLNLRLQRLLKVSKNLAQGDYHSRSAIPGEDEIAELASAFDHMAQTVEDRIRQLEESRAQVQFFNVRLEKKVTERTAELEATLGDLRQTQHSLVQSEKLASLGSVVAAVAHELNTPIGNARTVATSLSEKTARFAEAANSGLTRSTMDTYLAESSDAAKLIERNLHRAAELIQSFKHVAVDQTSSQRRPFDLVQTLNDVISTLRPGLKNTPFEIVEEFPSGIQMDSYPGAIGQIVTNLVNNSIRHAFEGRAAGHMRLRLNPAQQGQAEIDFRDDGVGMSDEVVHRIFDPFFTTAMGQGGSGLGMHIVHNLVTGLLGGQIDIHSQPGQGTQVLIRLPLQAPQKAQGESA